MAKLWHGHTNDSVLFTWSIHGWQQKAAETLIEIAKNRRCAASQRIDALKVYNTAMLSGLLDENRDFPALCCRVLVEVSTQEAPYGWLARRAQATAAERLAGVHCLLQTAANFVGGDKIESTGEVVFDASKAMS